MSLTLLALTAIPFPGAPPPPDTIQVPLAQIRRSAVIQPRAKRVFIPGGINQGRKLKAPPRGTWKLPTDLGEHPCYFMAKLGGAERLFIVTSDPTSKIPYNRLYIDRDGDGDLVEEPPIKSTGNLRQKGFYNRFSFTMIIATEQGKTAVPFGLTAYDMFLGKKDAKKVSPEATLNQLRVFLMTNSALAGSFTLAGEQFKVLIGDSNCNGFFGEKPQLKNGFPSPRIRPDLVFIGKDSELNYQNGLPRSEVLCFDNKIFQADYSKLPTHLLLTPYQGKICNVKLPLTLTNLSLVSKTDTLVTLINPGQQIQLPQASYLLVNYTATSKDDGGNTWQLAAKGDPNGKWLNFGVEATTLAIGEPFISQTLVRASGSRKKGNPTAYLSLSLLGAAGEKINRLSCLARKPKPCSIAFSQKKKTSPLEATYKVLDQSGNTVIQGSFRYG